MKKSTKWIIIIGFAVLVAALLSVYIAGRVTQKRKDAEITRLKDENQTFKRIVDKNKDTITVQEQRIVTLKMAEAALLIDNAALKAKGVKDASLILDLKTENTRLKLEASYDHPPVVVHDTVGIPMAKDYILTPLGWKFDDKWTMLRGTVKTTGVTIDSLITYSEPSIVLGYSKGFLKTSKPIIVFSDKNPYTVVRDMSNVVIINKPPFYKTPWFYRLEGAGLFGGLWYGISKIK